MRLLTVTSFVLSETHKNVVYLTQYGSCDNFINSFKIEKVFSTLIELYLKYISGCISVCNYCDLSIFASVQDIMLLTYFVKLINSNTH
jgi:hypothetical protein